MNNDFDVAIEDFGVAEEVTQNKAGMEFTGEQKFAPWHKPRKQWVREKQWWGSIANCLIKENGPVVGPQTVRYFGLPGEDLLDVRHLRKNLEERGAAISIFGLNHSPASWGRAQEQLSRLLDDPGICRSSCIERYNFNDLQHTHATLFRKIKGFGPFDVVNLDFCDNIIAPSFDNSRLSAIKNLIDYQLHFHPSPWVLFVTTRSSKASSSAEVFNALYELVKSNLASDEFVDSFSQYFTGVLKVEGNEKSLIEPSELDDACHSKLLVVGFLKWIFQAAVQEKCSAKLTSIVCYDIDGEKAEGDMISLCIRFTKNLSATLDNSGLVATTQPESLVENSEPVLAARALRKVAEMRSVDTILREDINLYSEMTKQKMSLLEAAGKAVDDYVEDVCTLDLQSFGISSEDFSRMLQPIPFG